MSKEKLEKYFSDKRCIICQSSLKRIVNDLPLYDFKYNSNNLGWMISYECSLFGSKHYRAYLDNGELKIEEEALSFILNGKEHIVTQYRDDNYVIVTVYDENGQYLRSSNFDLPVLTFDFIGDNLDKIVSRLKTMLTFQ